MVVELPFARQMAISGSFGPGSLPFIIGYKKLGHACSAFQEL